MAGQMQAEDPQSEEDVTVVQPESLDGPADLKQAVLGEPIIGVDPDAEDHRGKTALQPHVLPGPKEPTAAERERHNCTHLP